MRNMKNTRINVRMRINNIKEKPNSAQVNSFIYENL